MAVGTLSSASDSSDNIDLQPQLSGAPERGVADSNQLERVQDESRIIIDLMFKRVKIALDAVIQEQGGSRIVWESLDKSGYRNYKDLCTDLMNAVASYHAKLTARENHVSGDLSISQGELEGTLPAVLVNAFSLP